MVTVIEEIGETVMKTYDVEQGSEDIESVGVVIDAVIEDGKKSQTVFMENVEVLNPNDDAADDPVVNETAVSQFVEENVGEFQILKEVVEVIEDNDDKYLVMENVEVLSSEDEEAESVNEAEPFETEATDVVMENVEVLSSNDDVSDDPIVNETAVSQFVEETVDTATESVKSDHVEFQILKEVVEVIEDDDKCLVMENVEVLSPKDDATDDPIVNETAVSQFVEYTIDPATESVKSEHKEVVEVIEDDDKSLVMEKVEVLSSEDEAAELVNELEPPLETEVIDVVIENVEVLSSKDEAAESVNDVEPPLETEATNVVMENVEFLSREDETQTNIQLKGSVEDIVTFPATFVSVDIDIQFGSFGPKSVLKVEPECFANINNPDLIDLQENDKNVTSEGVDDIDGGQEDGQRVEVDESELKEEIKKAQLQLDEQRRCKDAIVDEIIIKWENMIVHNEALDSKNLELRAARQLVKSKKQHIDHVERVINKIRNAIAVEDIDTRINKAEHIMEHDTLCIEDEERFIREIKQLKTMRVQLASNMIHLDKIQQKDQVEELLKDLNAELKILKDEVLNAQVARNTTSKKYVEERERERELQAQFKVVEESCREASAHLYSLEKCLNAEVEKFIDEWNIDVVKFISEVTDSETQKTVKSIEEEHSGDQIKENVLEEVEQIMKNKEPVESTEILKIKEKEKTDELLKEEFEAKLKEKVRMEEEMKANQAQERKKRNAEKALKRAEKRAQQEAQEEAQQQEKRRLKRLRKREKKRASLEKKRAAASSSSGIVGGVVAESKEVENTNGKPQQLKPIIIPSLPAVVAVIRNKNQWRRGGNMVITFVVLVLSVLSFLIPPCIKNLTRARGKNRTFFKSDTSN